MQAVELKQLLTFYNSSTTFPFPGMTNTKAGSPSKQRRAVSTTSTQMHGVPMVT